LFKGSSDPSHFIFEINDGKRRIRNRTTLNLNFQKILSRSRNSSFNFRVVVCRIRLFPTLISKIKWLGSELPLNWLKIAVGDLDLSLRTNCFRVDRGRWPSKSYKSGAYNFAEFRAIFTYLVHSLMNLYSERSKGMPRVL